VADDSAPEIRPESAQLPEVPAHVGRDLTLYVLARFALVVVVAAVLTLINVPLLVSIAVGLVVGLPVSMVDIAVGLVVGLPVSMVVLRGWHQRVAAGLAARGMVRRAARDRLRAELRGETSS